MSSGSPNYIPKDSYLSNYTGSDLSDDGPLHGHETIPATTARNGTGSLPKRYNTLEEFSELERQTQETQRLQEEVEHATKLTMEKNGLTFTNSTFSHINYLPMFMDGSSDENSDVLSSCRQSVIQPLTYGLDGLDGLDLEVVRSSVTFPGKDVLENAIEEYSVQASEFKKQLNEQHEQHEQQKFSFRQSIIKLQTKLQEVQMEKDALTDLRMKETRKQADLMGKMQAVIRELQSTKQTGDHRLLEAEDKAKSLCKKSESLERTITEVYSTLLAYEKRCGNNSYISQDADRHSLGVAVEKVLQDIENENHRLRERLLLIEEQLGTQEQKCQGKAEIMMTEQRDRMEQLITSHDQEVAILTEKLSSSRSSASSLRVQVELLQKQAETQESVHQCQTSDLESALCILRSDLLDAQRGLEDKVGALEKQLAQAQSQVQEAQSGRDRSLQQADLLDSQLCQLTSELRQAHEELVLEQEQNKQLWERDTGHSVTIDGLRKELEERSLGVQQLETLVGSLKEDCQAQIEAQLSYEKQQREQREELTVLHGELGLAREQLQRARDEQLRAQALQEERDEEGKRLQALLDERERELQLRQQEAQQGRTRLEEAQSRSQALRAEAEVLRLKLEDREKMVDLLRLQMESTTHATVQHGRSIDALHEDKSRLSNQLNEHKLEIQQLRALLEQRDTSLAVLEREQSQQHAALAEQSRSVKELMLEKQQLTAELEVQRMQAVGLSEEQEELKRRHSSKSEEQEGVVVKLRSQLKTTRAELDQASSTLRTLEGADGHGLKVAMGMQKQITAKRELIDSLQGRIQRLEEMMEKLSQEKRYQGLESRRHIQELASVTEEKGQLAAEVETLRSLERQLRDKVTKLETALHKMSESFADCQEFIQLQEQEFVRLKLQHALDVKELQGQNLRATGSVQRAPLCSPTALTAAPASSQHISKGLLQLKPERLQCENPALELRSLVKELQGVISENHRPHTTSTATTSSSNHRRRSAPARVHRTTLNEVTEDIAYNGRITKETYSSEPHPLRTTDLDERNLNSTYSSESHDVSSTAPLPRFTSSPRAMSLGRRSPVHSLLTSDPGPSPLQPNRAEAAAGPLTLANPQELTGHECKHLQGKLDSLQNMVEDLQLKNHEMSSMLKGQERRMRKVKDKQRIYSKPDPE